MKLTKTVWAAVAAASVLATSASAAVVTLNPSAANAGAFNGSVLSATNGAFNTDKATTSFASLLTIESTPDAAGLVNTTETGFFRVVGFTGAPSSGVSINYNIYATFSISGQGTWVAPGAFSASPAGLSLTATLYGSPGSGWSVSTPTTANPYGITPDAGDFILGTATLLQGQSATAQLFGDNSAQTQFGALLDFIAAAGTTGVGGFWQAPFPFLVDLSTSATGVPPIDGNGTTWSTDGVNTYITTNVTSLGDGSGSGNILFATNRVPEPGSLALVGLALFTVAAVRRRSGGKA